MRINQLRFINLRKGGRVAEAGVMPAMQVRVLSL